VKKWSPYDANVSGSSTSTDHFTGFLCVLPHFRMSLCKAIARCAKLQKYRLSQAKEDIAF